MAARAEEIKGSVHILYYAQRGERSVQTGGASVQIYAPTHNALVGVDVRCNRNYLCVFKDYMFRLNIYFEIKKTVHLSRISIIYQFDLVTI